MAAIRHALQKDVFQPNDERLVSVVHVTKAKKEKKSTFLCAIVTKEKPISASICQVRDLRFAQSY